MQKLGHSCSVDGTDVRDMAVLRRSPRGPSAVKHLHLPLTEHPTLLHMGERPGQCAAYVVILVGNQLHRQAHPHTD